MTTTELRPRSVRLRGVRAGAAARRPQVLAPAARGRRAGGPAHRPVRDARRGAHRPRLLLRRHRRDLRRRHAARQRRDRAGVRQRRDRPAPGGLQGGARQPAHLRGPPQAPAGHGALHHLRAARQADLRPRRARRDRAREPGRGDPQGFELDHRAHVREQVDAGHRVRVALRAIRSSAGSSTSPSPACAGA